MANSYYVAPDLTATNALITTVDAVVDAIRATDFPTTDALIGVVDGLVDNLEAERLQRVVPHAAYHDEFGAAYGDIVNITDKGVLTGVSVHCKTAGDKFIKVIIDGVTIYDNEVVSTVDSAIGISFNHRFDTSLQVQAKEGAGASHNVVTWTID